ARSPPSTSAGASSCSSSRSWSRRRPRSPSWAPGGTRRAATRPSRSAASASARSPARSGWPPAWWARAAGVVGAGGGFLLVPLLLVIADIPIRVTIGSSLAIAALAAISGFTGKLVTGQIPLAPTLAVVAGGASGGRFGAAMSRRLPPLGLRVALFAFVTLTAITVWADLLGY